MKNNILFKKINFLSALIPSIILISCASIDPAEKVNRKIFAFNEKIDEYIVKPAASGYSNFIPSPLKAAINNIYNNIEDIYSIANNILQLKPKGIAEDTMRVAINTVFGLGGTIDVASKAGIPRHKEDLGQTLGYWGIPNGPYIILPILGPSTLRDSIGTAATISAGPTMFLDVNLDAAAISYNALNIVRIRANLLDLTNSVDELALDKYNFVRNAYLQKRKYDILDGNTPDDLENDEVPLPSSDPSIDRNASAVSAGSISEFNASATAVNN